jgi:hypothetical protein
MDLFSIRVITGDVARLAGFHEKATGVHDGRKKEGTSRTPLPTATWKPCGRLSRARFSSRARPAMTRRAKRGTWSWTHGLPSSAEASAPADLRLLTEPALF